MDVLILAGGLSHERDVSIRSGRRVAEALRGVGVKTEVRDVDSTLVPFLRTLSGTIVWPLLHGASGEDGSLQDVLEMCGVTYVGSDPRAARVAWSKPVAKTVAHQAGIATPDYVTLPASLFRELGAESVLDAMVDRLDLPLIVKPSRGGSALGVTTVTTRDTLPQAMVECFAYDEVALIEKAITGTEVTVSVVGDGDAAYTLPAVEIVTEGNYDYDARYNPGRTEYFAPARLDPDQARVVSEAALLAHRVLALRHLSRIDLILDSTGTPQLIDVNVAPGMTETSLFPQAIEASGRDLADVYKEIIGLARKG
ncbi:MAG: D-alanine--D-alanine ligase [Demequinaceae bacterium]|nr:D-alanine--D-alanine ligase [Demequinaceae bacterium]